MYERERERERERWIFTFRAGKISIPEGDVSFAGGSGGSTWSPLWARERAIDLLISGILSI
jgi:hypothetical protein